MGWFGGRKTTAQFKDSAQKKIQLDSRQSQLVVGKSLVGLCRVCTLPLLLPSNTPPSMHFCNLNIDKTGRNFRHIPRIKSFQIVGIIIYSSSLFPTPSRPCWHRSRLIITTTTSSIFSHFQSPRPLCPPFLRLPRRIPGIGRRPGAARRA
jgi:hypothetical protein